ncbi:MAG: hypothetical protein V9E94_13815 [Microthrixaceae bacterium]
MISLFEDCDVVASGQPVIGDRVVEPLCTGPCRPRLLLEHREHGVDHVAVALVEHDHHVAVGADAVAAVRFHAVVEA